MNIVVSQSMRPTDQREASVRAADGRNEATRRAMRRPMCRPMCRVVAAVGLVSIAAACTSRTKVELDSAHAPIVEPVDGAGQNDADVVDAGVVEIDDRPATETTDVQDPTTTPSVEPTESTDEPTTTSPATKGTVDPAVADQCEADELMLERAVERFRDDTGASPASEAELVIDSYLRRFSPLYEVEYNGTIVPQGTTCVPG